MKKNKDKVKFRKPIAKKAGKVVETKKDKAKRKRVKKVSLPVYIEFEFDDE